MYFISFQLFIKLGHHTQIKNAKHPRKGKHQKESVPWKTLSDGSQALKVISAQLITKSKTGAPDILRPYFERSEARIMPIVGEPRAITSFSKINIGSRRLSPEQIPYRNITSSWRHRWCEIIQNPIFLAGGESILLWPDCNRIWLHLITSLCSKISKSLTPKGRQYNNRINFINPTRALPFARRKLGVWFHAMRMFISEHILAWSNAKLAFLTAVEHRCMTSG